MAGIMRQVIPAQAAIQRPKRSEHFFATFLRHLSLTGAVARPCARA
jgi:hypothetical protein